MSHEAFRQAIRQNPRESPHRLVYADWIEDSERDGFLAAQWRSQKLVCLLSGDNGDGGSGGRSGRGGGNGGGDGDGGGSGSIGSGGGASGRESDGGGNGDGNGDGDSEIDRETRNTFEDYFMARIGQKVLIHARGSYYPYVWCGEVVDVIDGSHYVLKNAAQLPSTRLAGVTWLGIASGDTQMRGNVRVVLVQGEIDVYDVCYAVEWVGDLPTKNQH